MQVGNKDNAEKTVFFPTFGTLCSTWFWYILAKIVRAITIHNPTTRLGYLEVSTAILSRLCRRGGTKDGSYVFPR